MTKTERERVSALLSTTEYLFMENMALKLLLEHRGIENWRKFSDRLMGDRELLAGVHLKFHDVYKELRHSADPSHALIGLLAELPSRKPS
jgi:hypothetical protein